ncbi:hypothetical protein Z517_01866 [Fonsecaea pedrosoi CBS 271.37]|uniref:BZIP domain-containing protein n=1 Tax=Fonsecaea pedrosoi CBS 271.37 TaxID=1442368 RepID=A0A0D2GZL1_9EURO|nr:uncharacterized protein Z517_01866 [Fonsecaea pedrosoi CBS 271.37]KIW86468.1 hypothetical protein Z517_01866 [Fonsecaea pedrosoi CBS 271.37]
MDFCATRSRQTDTPRTPKSPHDNKLHSLAAVDAKDPPLAVSPGRLRKRESDRRSQRQARERTKTHIAHLEAIVEEFRRRDASGQVAVLMKKLTELERERDAMVKNFHDIWSVVKPYYRKWTAVDLVPDCGIRGGVVATSAAQGTQDEGCRAATADGGDSLVVQDTYSFDDGTTTSLPPPMSSEEARVNVAESEALPNSLTTPRLPSNTIKTPGPVVFLGPERVKVSSPAPTPRDCGGRDPVKKVYVNFSLSNYAPGWAYTSQRCSCCHETCTPLSRGREDGSMWRGNQWTFANEVLGERLSWAEGEKQPATDIESDDVPIRALLEGWSSVAQRGRLHPSWQILRHIDETLFSMCPNVERLAILRAMHTLLQFHTEPTHGRYTRLPPWYSTRRQWQQTRSYAIDYFAWPSLRDRFIQNEHRYCGNEFWSLFCSSLKILWPYQFRDCYVQEEATGLYKVSPLFDQRLLDLNCWTMGPDIFHRFPELSSDIPAFSPTPHSLSQPASAGATGLGARRVGVSALDTTGTSSSLSEIAPTGQAGCADPNHKKGNKYHDKLSTTITATVLPKDTAVHYPLEITPPEASLQNSLEGLSSSSHQYNIGDLSQAMAVDAFINGIIDEADLETIWPSGNLCG